MIIDKPGKSREPEISKEPKMIEVPQVSEASVVADVSKEVRRIRREGLRTSKEVMKIPELPKSG